MSLLIAILDPGADRIIEFYLILQDLYIYINIYQNYNEVHVVTIKVSKKELTKQNE